ncbi:MAG: hypothetical protein M5R42_12490 [Rhodocyclaceae bacterium]|nr:hypothetical protein [Rhodocyclaceae bacterium]
MTLKSSAAQAIDNAKKALKDTLRKEHLKRHFVTNGIYLVPGLIGSAAVLAWAGFSAAQPEPVFFFMIVWLTGWTFGVLRAAHAGGEHLAHGAAGQVAHDRAGADDERLRHPLHRRRDLRPLHPDLAKLDRHGRAAVPHRRHQLRLLSLAAGADPGRAPADG